MMQLMGLSISPFYERAALVVFLKGAPKEVVKLNAAPFQLKSEEHFKVNPLGKIPVLVFEDGSGLFESQVIAEYLNDVLPGTSLMPEDAKERARVRLVCRMVDLYLAPFVQNFWSRKSKSRDELEALVKDELPKVWDNFEAIIDGDGYLIGKDWTLADVAMLPFVYHLENAVAPYGDWGVGERPKLINWFAHVGASEEAKASSERAKRGLKILQGDRS